MGMFDWVEHQELCPKCGALVTGFQSKSGPCQLLKLRPDQVERYYAGCRACDLFIEHENDPSTLKPIYQDAQQWEQIETLEKDNAALRREVEALKIGQASMREYAAREMAEMKFRELLEPIGEAHRIGELAEDYMKKWRARQKEGESNE